MVLIPPSRKQTQPQPSATTSHTASSEVWGNQPVPNVGANRDLGVTSFTQIYTVVIVCCFFFTFLLLSKKLKRKPFNNQCLRHYLINYLDHYKIYEGETEYDELEEHTKLEKGFLFFECLALLLLIFNMVLNSDVARPIFFWLQTAQIILYFTFIVGDIFLLSRGHVALVRTPNCAVRFAACSIQSVLFVVDLAVAIGAGSDFAGQSVGVLPVSVYITAIMQTMIEGVAVMMEGVESVEGMVDSVIPGVIVASIGLSQSSENTTGMMAALGVTGLLLWCATIFSMICWKFYHFWFSKFVAIEEEEEDDDEKDDAEAKDDDDDDDDDDGGKDHRAATAARDSNLSDVSMATLRKKSSLQHGGDAEEEESENDEEEEEEEEEHHEPMIYYILESDMFEAAAEEEEQQRMQQKRAAEALENQRRRKVAANAAANSLGARLLNRQQFENDVGFLNEEARKKCAVANDDASSCASGVSSREAKKPPLLRKASAKAAAAAAANNDDDDDPRHVRAGVSAAAAAGGGSSGGSSGSSSATHSPISDGATGASFPSSKLGFGGGRRAALGDYGVTPLDAEMIPPGDAIAASAAPAPAVSSDETTALVIHVVSVPPVANKKTRGADDDDTSDEGDGMRRRRRGQSVFQERRELRAKLFTAAASSSSSGAASRNYSIKSAAPGDGNINRNTSTRRRAGTISKGPLDLKRLHAMSQPSFLRASADDDVKLL